MSGDKKRGRPLSAEEKRLWRLIQQQTTPLRQEAEEIAPQENPLPERTQELSEAKTRPKKVLESPSPQPLPPVKPGEFAGVDRATVTRLKRGSMRIERRIDLHGFSRDEACDALQHFLLDAYNHNKKLVLVITGKGTRAQEMGVLKASLPIWLNLPAMRHCVLAYHTARIEHGGEGAYYVLLKKKRVKR